MYLQEKKEILGLDVKYLMILVNLNRSYIIHPKSLICN